MNSDQNMANYGIAQEHEQSHDSVKVPLQAKGQLGQVSEYTWQIPVVEMREAAEGALPLEQVRRRVGPLHREGVVRRGLGHGWQRGGHAAARGRVRFRNATGSYT